ncbi:zf-HC2 domain-containing protein [Cellulomonas biazotea]|uniref:zf-HC2 domain-containing protein n=2 Tax=Cellulomonas biazotea TaxID=1709 RepID=UPI0035EA0C56
MSHLGSRISALVDGQLSVAATERALAHVALCPTCAAELSAARAARRALASAADDVPPPSDLTARLLSLAPDGCDLGGRRAVPPRDPFAAPPDPRALAAAGLVPRSWTGRPGSDLHGDLRPRRNPVRLAVGSVAGLGAVAAMLFVLGERPEIVPVSHPGADLELLSQATTTTGAASGRPTFEDVVDAGGQVDASTTQWLRSHAWSFPTALPTGWAVTGLRWSGDDGSVLEVDVTGPAGSVVVTEQQGRLDVDALSGAGVQELGGRTVYVLSGEPSHVAWQCDSTVVQVVGADGHDVLGPLVAAFPGGAYDDGVHARITRGWQTVTGALQTP